MELALLLSAGLLTSVWTVPQILRLYATKRSEDISLPALWTLVIGLTCWVWYDILVGLPLAAVVTAVGLGLNLVQVLLASYYKKRENV